MNWAVGRRLFFISCFFFFIIGIGVIVAVPFFNKPPTCFDHKKNGDEVGMDCGGSCEYVCNEQVRPFKVDWYRGLQGSSKTIDLVAYFSNKNQEFAIKQASYRFIAYDKQGTAIITKEGTTGVPANSNMVVFNGPFSTGEKKVDHVTFEWTSPLLFSRVSPAALSKHVVVKDIVFDQDPKPHLSVNIQNTTRDTYKNLPIIVVIYDKDGNALLASKTFIDTLLPDGKETVYFSWNREPVKEFGNIEILPLFDQFTK